jgi:hypothetical protein
MAGKNEGLRPHLTLWQAKLQRWYEISLKLEENKLKTPQELQKKFPEYQYLANSMREVNNNLMHYSKYVFKLVSCHV